MRTLVLTAIIAFAMTFVAAEASDPAKPSDPIEAIIGQQIEAFRRDDAVAAFSFASPAIRKRFGTAEVFIAMVAQGYPQVYRPRSYRFVDRTIDGGSALQRVMVVGPAGATVMALYEVIRVDGRWRINGCRIVKLPGRDA